MFFNQFEALLFYLHPLSVHAHFAVSCIDLFKIDDGPVIKQGGFVFGSFSSYHPLPCYVERSESYFIDRIEVSISFRKGKSNRFFFVLKGTRIFSLFKTTANKQLMGLSGNCCLSSPGFKKWEMREFWRAS